MKSDKKLWVNVFEQINKPYLYEEQIFNTPEEAKSEAASAVYNYGSTYCCTMTPTGIEDWSAEIQDLIRSEYMTAAERKAEGEAQQADDDWSDRNEK